MFSKILKYNSCFDRVFLSLPLDKNKEHHIKLMGTFNINEIVIPLKQAATFFIQKGDIFVIDEVSDINSLQYLDYELTKNDASYKNTFEAFMALCNLEIQEKGKFALEVGNRIIYNNLLLIAVSYGK